MRDGLSVKVPVSGQVTGLLEQEELQEAIQTGKFTYGINNEVFADRLKRFIGTRYAILCNSGSSADLLAVGALKSSYLNNPMSEGDYIITTALSFPTTINAIVLNGFKPVFVDSDLDTLNVNVEAVNDAIVKVKNEKPWRRVGMLFTHTLGNPFDIGGLPRRFDLIEDNCDALGSEYKNRRTGSFGVASTYSFYPAHHITTGEGGAVLTSNPEFKRAVESLCSWGKDCWCDPGFDNTCGKRFEHNFPKLPEGYDHKYTFSQVGYNLKMTHLQATIGAAQMQQIEDFTFRRRTNHAYLLSHLDKYEEFLSFQKPLPDANPSWFGFAITVKENAPFTRELLVRFLEDCGIATRPVFAGNIIRHPAYDKVSYKVVGDLKNSDYIMRNTFWIGCWHGLAIDQLDYVIERMEQFMREWN